VWGGGSKKEAACTKQKSRRDGRVATFRPIRQSVSGVGVRFSIGDKIRNLGEKSFCLTRREGKFFILLAVL
jgi:hypothetical protein